MTSWVGGSSNRIAGAWGIDLGRRSLKILHLALSSDSKFPCIDFVSRIPYPSLPNSSASWSERVALSLESFLRQNSFEGDLVAASIPELWCLLTHSQIPALNDDRILDLVSYEARMQIPLPLDEIVWDYQCIPIPATAQEGHPGMDLLTLVAVKIEHFDEVLNPFHRVRCPLDILQVRSVATANLVFHEGILDRSQGPVGILDIGVDESWLTVIHQSRILRHSVSASTKTVTTALAGTLGLSQDQADSLRRSLAPSSLAPKVLEALKAPYAILAESAHRALELCLKDTGCEALIIVGDGSRLPLLDRVLGKRIGCQVRRLDSFARIEFNRDLVSEKAVKSGLEAFTPACGLALQAIGLSNWETNLLPDELRVQHAAPSGGIRSWFGKKRRPG